eukprot:COSAG06_NODE_379_length_16608_cov_83.792477_17_plen_187_part_00
MLDCILWARAQNSADKEVLLSLQAAASGDHCDAGGGGGGGGGGGQGQGQQQHDEEDSSRALLTKLPEPYLARAAGILSCLVLSCLALSGCLWLTECWIWYPPTMLACVSTSMCITQCVCILLIVCMCVCVCVCVCVCRLEDLAGCAGVPPLQLGQSLDRIRLKKSTYSVLSTSRLVDTHLLLRIAS